MLVATCSMGSVMLPMVPSQNQSPGPSMAIFLAMDGPPRPFTAAVDGPPRPSMAP